MPLFHAGTEKVVVSVVVEVKLVEGFIPATKGAGARTRGGARHIDASKGPPFG